MSRYRYYNDYYAYPRYVSVGEKQGRNRKAIEKLRKSNPDARPVVVDGRTIAKSWWGKSWGANLERYADYSNRIGRGRSYVRHGAVLDLRIDAGTVSATVQGSRSSPYEVVVTIEKLPATVWRQLRDVSLGQLDSLTDLLAGQFPKALKDTFFAQGTGLFPAPKEIAFDCSCPDWASMCKHVAAALYGIGNRLDTSPELLFTLRQVTIDDLIAHTVDATAEGLISKADKAAGDDVLVDADLSDVFGIELDDGDSAPVDLPAPSAKPTRARSKTKTKSKSKSKSKSKKKKTPRRAATKPKSRVAGEAASSPAAEGSRPKRRRRAAKSATPKPGQMLEQLVAALGASRATFTTADLAGKLPAWSGGQVTNTLQRAISRGLVERVARGVYRRA